MAIGIIGLLVGSRNSNVSVALSRFALAADRQRKEAETNNLVRCLVELALASNAPTSLKSQVGPPYSKHSPADTGPRR